VKLALYSYWRSSSAWRVRIGLHWKGVAFEYRAVNLLEGEQLREAHQARNPMSHVPVLEVEEGGRLLRLAQSVAILEWLDERYPERPLLPRDPDGRARVRAIVEHVNSSIQPYQNTAVLKWLGEHSTASADWIARFIGGGMAGLEAVVRAGAGRFCHGDEVTLADLYVVPQLYAARRFGAEVAHLPTLLRVEESCRGLDAFAKSEPGAQPDAPPAVKR
jgi:maleylpyruvate isomerase